MLVVVLKKKGKFTKKKNGKNRSKNMKPHISLGMCYTKQQAHIHVWLRFTRPSCAGFDSTTIPFTRKTFLYCTWMVRFFFVFSSCFFKLNFFSTQLGYSYFVAKIRVGQKKHRFDTSELEWTRAIIEHTKNGKDKKDKWQVVEKVAIENFIVFFSLFACHN